MFKGENMALYPKRYGPQEEDARIGGLFNMLQGKSDDFAVPESQRADIGALTMNTASPIPSNIDVQNQPNAPMAHDMPQQYDDNNVSGTTVGISKQQNQDQHTPTGASGLVSGDQELMGATKKPSLFGKIASYALPALTGLAGGAGIIPGLLSAYLNNRSEENVQRKLDTSSQAEADRAKKAQAQIDFQNKKLDETLSETKAHNRAMEGIGKSKEGKENDRDRFIRIHNALIKNDPEGVTPGDVEWYKNYKELANKRGQTKAQADQEALDLLGQ